MAGRLVDGYTLAADGQPPGWTPPRWIRALEDQGFDAATEGEPFFVVTHLTIGEVGRFPTIREALRFALDGIREQWHPESLTIDCRTATGRIAPVVWGRPLVGMARGALEDEPIRVVEAPGP